MRRVDGILEIEEIFDIIEQGTTMPVRCRLSNGLNVIVKYMNNPYGQMVLVNEFVGNCVADVLGVTIPEFGICNLSENVISSTNVNESIDERNSGPAFFSSAHTKTTPLQRRLLPSIINKETERLIVLDHILNNHDRHEGNILCDISSGAKIYAIDHSHIFTKVVSPSIEVLERELTKEALFSPSILIDNKELYDMLCSGVSYNENEIRNMGKWVKEKLTPTEIEKIKKSLPEMWINSVGNDKINKIFEILNYRASHIEEISEMIIEERRKM